MRHSSYRAAAAFCAALCLIAAVFSSCGGSGSGSVEVSTEADTLLADSSRPVVCDADYSVGASERSYTNDEGVTISLDDIKLPYINIDSADAVKANKAIKALYDSLATSFRAEMGGMRTSWDKASYRQDDSNGTITVIITVTSGGWGSETEKIYAWAFSRSDGSAQTVNADLTKQAA